jgi:hypothetical protein
MDFSAEQLAEFWDNVDMTGDCWLWTGTGAGYGYGRFNVNGESLYAHRVSLELKLGRPIAPGLQAGHLPIICHNRRCVNPHHLDEKTRSQNMRDRRLDGTANNRHNLTADQVRAIRADTRPYHITSAEYGIDGSSVAHIKSRRCYSNIV